MKIKWDKKRANLGRRLDRFFDPFLLIKVGLINHRKSGNVYRKVSTNPSEAHRGRTRIEIVGEEIVVPLSDRVQESNVQCKDWSNDRAAVGTHGS